MTPARRARDTAIISDGGVAMTLMIDQLRREHEGLVALLRVLERQAAVLAEAAGTPDTEALAALAEYFTDYPQQVHHPKEDLIWRALKARDRSAAAAIGDIESEHRHRMELRPHVARAIDAIPRDAEVRRDAAGQVVRRFVDAERRHIEKEEKLFFPAAARTLKAEDWAEIAARAGQRQDPLASTAADERFAALRRMIAQGTDS